MRVLSVSDAFTPGVRGGSTRHLVNTVARLGDAVAFWVLTRDRDIGAAHPYDLPLDTWTPQGTARVRYSTAAGRSLPSLARAIREANPHVILTNSAFSRLVIRVLILHRAGAVPKVPILIAPDGEFQPGALALREWRKRAFVAAVRLCGGYRHVVWRATSTDEAADIRRLQGSHAPIVVVPSVIAGLDTQAAPPPAKVPGRARVVYVSRVTPKKNLLFLLRLLESFEMPLDLGIVGPIDDAAYGEQCRRAAERIRKPVTVRWLGEVQPGEVGACFAGAHVSVLPTAGENFGFAILESLAQARPVLVSTETPWRHLAPQRAGWDVPLADPAAWRTTLERLVSMDQTEYDRWSAGARAMAEQFVAADRAPALLEETLRRLAERSGVLGP